MYTPDQIEAMDNPTAQANFATLAEDWFGHDRWKADFARAIGFKRNAITKWMSVGRPPLWAFLIISAWIDLRTAQNALRGIRDGLRVAEGL